MWHPKLIFLFFSLVFWVTKQIVDVVAVEEGTKLSFNVLRNEKILGFSAYVNIKDFSSCFGENGVQAADFTSSSVFCRSQILLVHNNMGQKLGEPCLCKFDIKPLLFLKRKEFKSFEINSIQVDTYWDFSLAKFEFGPKSLEGFCLAVVFNREIKRIFTMSSSLLRRNKLYGTKSQFWDNDQNHNLSIECDTIGVDNPFLAICIDNKMVMQLLVEVFWDVHNWLFGLTIGNGILILETYSSIEKLFDFLLSFLIFCNTEFHVVLCTNLKVVKSQSLQNT
ncbi:hypothetical protein PVL29_005442 [Vitis rotundifolia]|uniref:Uncharacterized protein n=1 Tax=Vitis rotundifolia TaxID=103349 RepID=A0AA39AB01_VITRO|nr:hypothetical protein PVL29_005442 [Vitis rotundifolia]